MFWILLILLLIILIIILALVFSKTQIEFRLVRHKGVTFSFVVLHFLNGLFRLQFHIDIGKTKQSLASKKADLKFCKLKSLSEIKTYTNKSKTIYKKYKNEFNYLKAKIKIENISLKAKIGVNDAAATAVTIGSLYNVSYIVIGYISNYIKLEKHSIMLIPYFDDKILDINFNCIISFKIGHIIIMGIKRILKRW